jgi:aryl-alcohol dehydrogenase-like predicted oxidoreductase
MSTQIEKIPFGRTGHSSSRTIFGAAALGAMRQERADRVLETLLAYGVNHIDAAASYGDAELRIRPWMEKHRDDFFLATKTHHRSYEGARASLEASLERLGVEQIDLIQLHNVVDEPGWTEAMGPGGALEALIEARERGAVRFLGVTGHGTVAPAMHLRSLERFDFDAVLFPYNFAMLAQPQYATDVQALLDTCRERKVATQTIKSIARRRWQGEDGPRFSWYEPLVEREAIERAVRWTLGVPGLFVNTSSDARLLPTILEAAVSAADRPSHETMQGEIERYAIEPLFVPGQDGI